MAAGLPPRPNAADVEDALDYVSTPPNGSPVARTLAAEVLHLRARVAELLRQLDDLQAVNERIEAEREAVATEWGVRRPDGSVFAGARNSEQANRRVAGNLGGALMQRDVYAPGPWRAAQ